MPIRGVVVVWSRLMERDGQFLLGKLLQLAWGVTATVNLMNKNDRRGEREITLRIDEFKGKRDAMSIFSIGCSFHRSSSDTESAFAID